MGYLTQKDWDKVFRKIENPGRGGLLPMEKAAIIQEAQRMFDRQRGKIIDEAAEIGFMLMVGIPVQVMHEKYGWRRNKRLPEFADYILSYYYEFQEGKMTIQDYQKLIFEQTGLGFTIRENGESNEDAVRNFQSWISNQ